MCFEVYPAKDRAFRKKFRQLPVEQRRKRPKSQHRFMRVQIFHNFNDLLWNSIAYGKWWNGDPVRLSDYPLIIEHISD